MQSPARWVAGRDFRPLSPGIRQAVVADRRVLLVGDQTQLVDEQAVDDLGSAYHVPAALGDGYLFAGKRSVRFASTFTGQLTTIVTTAHDVREIQVGVGLKCVLVRVDENKPALFELPTGKPLPLAPPGLSELFGTPQGMVALFPRILRSCPECLARLFRTLRRLERQDHVLRSHFDRSMEGDLATR